MHLRGRTRLIKQQQLGEEERDCAAINADFRDIAVDARCSLEAFERREIAGDQLSADKAGELLVKILRLEVRKEAAASGEGTGKNVYLVFSKPHTAARSAYLPIAQRCSNPRRHAITHEAAEWTAPVVMRSEVATPSLRRRSASSRSEKSGSRRKAARTLSRLWFRPAPPRS